MSKHWDPRRSARSGQWDRHRRPAAPLRKPARRGRGENRVVWLAVAFAGAALYQFADPPPVERALPVEGSVQIASPAAVRVIDGDTFDYGGMRIRIADIDTPEVDGRCAHESALAASATRRLGALLSAGAFELHAAPGGRDEDRYGRKLRIVTRDGQSLGDALVAEGLARPWAGRREPWCA